MNFFFKKKKKYKTNLCLSTEKKNKRKTIKKIDQPIFSLLILLYLIQGVPVGLTFGSLPFILKSKLTYSELGKFSLVTYPYAFKIIWSPIVDLIYSNKIGKRKSWIIPSQLFSGILMIYLGINLNEFLDNPREKLTKYIMLFFFLIFFCATQDIAVDGWALTSVSEESLSIVSISQSIGINIGYFLSFVVFLSLNSESFMKKYFGFLSVNVKILSLNDYLKFWGITYIIISFILFLIPEIPKHLKTNNNLLFSKTIKNSDDVIKQTKIESIKKVYKTLYKVMCLKNVQTFLVILLVSKLGFQVSELALSLKLIERGFLKEDLSLTFLIDFPFQIFFGYLTGSFLTKDSYLKPWLYGYIIRLFLATLSQLLVFFFPLNEKNKLFFFLLYIFHHMLQSFISTVQYVSLCGFYTQIADPAVGGSYITILNTFSNFGSFWSRILIFFLIDKFSVQQCIYKGKNKDLEIFDINSTSDREKCMSFDGLIKTLRDGFYITNFIFILTGSFLLLWINKKINVLLNSSRNTWIVALK